MNNIDEIFKLGAIKTIEKIGDEFDNLDCHLLQVINIIMYRLEEINFLESKSININNAEKKITSIKWLDEYTIIKFSEDDYVFVYDLSLMEKYNLLFIIHNYIETL